MSTRRAIETTLLVCIGVLLAVAVAHDVTRQVRVNHRLVADLATWRAYTGRPYHNLQIEQDLKTHTTREVVCGNVTPGAPKQRVQLCLVMIGPVKHGRRTVHGGYHLPPRQLYDRPAERYACFGPAKEDALCP